MTTVDARRRWKIFVLKLLVGGVIGAGLATAAITLMDDGVFAFRDYLPLTIAAIYVLGGLTVWLNPTVRRTRMPGESLWPRCVLMLVCAATLAAPALMPSSIAPPLALTIVVLLWFISWRVFRYVVSRADELMKRVIADTNQMAMECALPLLFFYGAAERLGIVSQGASIWVVNGMVVWLYFMMASFAWMRRGLDNPLVAEE